jgi:hypothetical protein
MTNPADRLRVSDPRLRHVEWELSHEVATRRELERQRLALIEDGAPKDYDEIPRRSALAWSDPTGNKAARIVDGRTLAQMECILAAIECTRRECTAPVRRFWRLRYHDGYPIDTLCAKLGIDRATAYRWRRGIALRVGQRLGFF